MDFLKKLTDEQVKLGIYVMAVIVFLGFIAIPVLSVKGIGFTAMDFIGTDHVKFSDSWWAWFYLIGPACAAFVAFKSEKIKQEFIPGVALILPFVLQLIFCDNGGGMIKMGAGAILTAIVGLVAIAMPLVFKSAAEE